MRALLLLALALGAAPDARAQRPSASEVGELAVAVVEGRLADRIDAAAVARDIRADGYATVHRVRRAAAAARRASLDERLRELVRRGVVTRGDGRLLRELSAQTTREGALAVARRLQASPTDLAAAVGGAVEQVTVHHDEMPAAGTYASSGTPSVGELAADVFESVVEHVCAAVDAAADVGERGVEIVAEVVVAVVEAAVGSDDEEEPRAYGESEAEGDAEGAEAEGEAQTSEAGSDG